MRYHTEMQGSVLTYGEYNMSKFREKGYFVKENAPIYLKMDMDRTAKWLKFFLDFIHSNSWMCFREILYAISKYTSTGSTSYNL